MADVEFLSSAGTATGYVALPVVAHGSATIVLHDWASVPVASRHEWDGRRA